ncbi:MAG: hypothetical protein EXR79_02225 [Myxococcales bacterium]|nr:hypothetical protein [Myxococcales bacterium]
MTGKGGLGLLWSQGSVPVMTLRYWRTDFAIEALAGMERHIEAPSPPPLGSAATVIEPAATAVRVALGALYRIGDQPHTSLLIGARPWVHITYETKVVRRYDANGSSTTDAQTGESTPVHFGVDLPLVAELFLNDHFGLLGSVALSVRFGAPTEAAPRQLASRAGGGSWLVELGGGWAGGLGAVFYF